MAIQYAATAESYLQHDRRVLAAGGPAAAAIDAQHEGYVRTAQQLILNPDALYAASDAEILATWALTSIPYELGRTDSVLPYRDLLWELCLRFPTATARFDPKFPYATMSACAVLLSSQDRPRDARVFITLTNWAKTATLDAKLWSHGMKPADPAVTDEARAHVEEMRDTSLEMARDWSAYFGPDWRATVGADGPLSACLALACLLPYAEHDPELQNRIDGLATSIGYPGRARDLYAQQGSQPWTETVRQTYLRIVSSVPMLLPGLTPAQAAQAVRALQKEAGPAEKAPAQPPTAWTLGQARTPTLRMPVFSGRPADSMAAAPGTNGPLATR